MLEGAADTDSVALMLALAATTNVDELEVVALGVAVAVSGGA